jgi:hypothetical protein
VVEEKAELDSEDMNCDFESRADTVGTLERQQQQQ